MLFYSKHCTLGGTLDEITHIKGNIKVLIHGDIGCFNVFHKINMPVYSSYSKIYTTNLKEIDVIRGGIEKLEKGIEFLLTSGKTDLIVVLTTCLTEIMGENVDDAVFELKKKFKVPIVFIKTSGLYPLKINRIVDNLNLNLMKLLKNTQKEDGINLIGIANFEEEEGKELLKIAEDLNIRINTMWAQMSHFEDFLKLPRGRLNVVTSDVMYKNFLKEFKKKFNTDFIIVTPPYGISGTYNFFKEILIHINLESSIQKLEELKEFYKKKAEELEKKVLSKRIGFFTGETRIGIIHRMIQHYGLQMMQVFKDAGAEFVLFFLTDEAYREEITKISENYLGTKEVYIKRRPFEFLELFKKIPLDLLITESHHKIYALKAGKKFFYWQNLKMGFSGYLKSLKKIVQYINER